MKEIAKLLILMLLLIVMVTILIACKTEVVKLSTPLNVRIEGENIIWDSVQNADEYRLTFESEEAEGCFSSHSSVNSHSTRYIVMGSYKIKVQSFNVNNPKKYTASDWSEEITHIVYTRNLIYTSIDNDTAYSVSASELTESMTSASTSIFIPASYNGKPVTEIGDNAFSSYNYDFNKLVIADGISRIGKNAFKSTSMKEIVLPKSLRIIDEEAFSPCNNLNAISLPDGLETIGYRAFAGGKIKSIVIPNSVKEIGGSAFSCCFLLENIIFEAESKLETIGATAFYDCRKLIASELPDSVTHIGSAAFYGTKTHIDTEDYVVYVGKWAVGYKETNNNPKTIIIDSGTVGVADGCFAHSSIVAIEIPTSIQIIGEYAFQGCKLLVEIHVPSSVINIGKGTFLNCENLKTVSLYRTAEQGITLLGTEVFDVNWIISIYVNDLQSLIAYSQQPNASNYSSCIKIRP